MWMVSSLGRSHRASCRRPREVTSGVMKVRLLSPSRRSTRTLDLVSTTTNRRKTMSKTRLFKKRPCMLHLTAAQQDPAIRNKKVISLDQERTSTSTTLSTAHSKSRATTRTKTTAVSKKSRASGLDHLEATPIGSSSRG